MSVSKNATYSVLTQIPTQIFGIISGIFITRILGAEGRGLYAIYYADISLFTTLLDFSIITALIYFSASKKITEPKIIGIASVFSILTVLLTALILVIWLNTPYSSLLFPKMIIKWQFILLFFIFIVISQINTIYSGLFQGIQKFNIVNKVLFFNSVSNLSLFGLAYFLHVFGYFKIDFFIVLCIGLFVILINCIQWHNHFRKHFSYTVDLNLNWKTEIKPFFQFMGLGHISNIINFFNYRLVLWILAYKLTDKDVGIFSLAAGLTQMLYFISTPLSQVLMPFLSSEEHERKKQQFQKFARVHFTLVLILGAAGAIMSPLLIPILYGSEFNDAAILFEIMLIGILLSCQTKIFASYLLSDGRVVLNLYATIIGFLLTLSFNFTLIDAYGLWGAAVAQTLSLFGIFLFVYVAIYTFAKIGTTNLFIVNFNDIRYVWSKFKRKSGEIS